MQEIQATIRRWRVQCGLGECLDEPGLFHLEYLVSTWADIFAEHANDRRREASIQ